MADLTTLRTQRPDKVQVISYTPAPDYYKHRAEEDRLAILVCQIKIWQAKNYDWFSIPKAEDCLTIRECESIEVTNSSKNLINKAVVRFPRGTVIHQSSKSENKVTVGEEDDGTALAQMLKDANIEGDIITTPTALYTDDGTSTTSMAMNYDDKGLIDFNRTKTEPALLSPNDLAVGNRIEIRLGYAYSETEFDKMNKADSDPNLDLVFTGFITSISATTPLELECDDMGYLLTTISTPNIPASDGIQIKDFLDDDGKWHLLKDTGIKLAESSKNCEITVSGAEISSNLTVADVLSAWINSGVICVFEASKDGSVQLRVGYNFSTGSNGSALPNNDKKYITYNGGNNSVTLIQFDWDVAQDKLTMKRCDKKYIAVEAQGFYTDKDHGKFVSKTFKLTLRKNPDNDDEGWVDDGSGEFQTVNFRSYKMKKNTKHKDGTDSSKRINGHLSNKVDLKKYTVINYISPTLNITQPQLIEEAKQYWANYNPNGMGESPSLLGGGEWAKLPTHCQYLTLFVISRFHLSVLP